MRGSTHNSSSTEIVGSGVNTRRKNKTHPGVCRVGQDPCAYPDAGVTVQQHRSKDVRMPIGYPAQSPRATGATARWQWMHWNNAMVALEPCETGTRAVVARIRNSNAI